MARTYSSDEVVEILKRVRDSGADLTTFTELELRDIAREAGLNPDEVGPAALALRREKAISRHIEDVVGQRRAAWWHAFFTYLIVNTGLAVGDWLGGPGWWVHWVLLGWGVGIALGAKRAFFADRTRLALRAGKHFDKQHRREQREAARRAQVTTPRAFVDAIDEMAARVVHAASDKVEDAIRSGSRVRVEATEPESKLRERSEKKKKRR